MHFQQVALTVLAFSAAHDASVQNSAARSQIFILPPASRERIVVERDPLQQAEVSHQWLVRLVRNSLDSPIYFPPVHTEAGLQAALAEAWEFHRKTTPPAPFLTRFLEPRLSPPPRIASPPPPQTGSLRRKSQHPG